MSNRKDTFLLRALLQDPDPIGSFVTTYDRAVSSSRHAPSVTSRHLPTTSDKTACIDDRGTNRSLTNTLTFQSTPLTQQNQSFNSTQLISCIQADQMLSSIPPIMWYDASKDEAMTGSNVNDADNRKQKKRRSETSFELNNGESE